MKAMFGPANTSEGGGISTQPERHLSGQNEINIPSDAFSVKGTIIVGFLSTQHTSFLEYIMAGWLKQPTWHHLRHLPIIHM